MENSNDVQNTTNVGNEDLADVTNRTFIKGQKVKVLVGCIWQKAEIENYHSDAGWYLCGTRNWSTHFHESSIKTI